MILDLEKETKFINIEIYNTYKNIFFLLAKNKDLRKSGFFLGHIYSTQNLPFYFVFEYLFTSLPTLSL